MITMYTWTTPNGRKPAIMLEEIGLPYRVKLINLGKDEQFDAGFLKISPNNKIPAIVDDEAEGGALAIFESGAILTYLAEKSGLLLAPNGAERYKALEWLYWQIGGLGPMLGQLGFFAVRAEQKSPFAIQRFIEESERLLSVMESRLAQVPYLAGANYSIADIACYPWVEAVSSYLSEPLADSLASRPALCNWLENVGTRPAVQRGMQIPNP